MEAKTGRIVAMASQPTYDPSVWVGGITKNQLARLYSEKAGTPLLGRATQGQFAPGSTWKPFMTVGALNNGFSPSTRLDCSSGLQVGNRWFKNYESGIRGLHRLRQGAEVSCNTFFYRVGLHYWQKYGTDPTTSTPATRSCEQAKEFGFGSETGHRPARRGLRPDRRPALEARLLQVDEGLLLQGSPAAADAPAQRLRLRLRPRVLPRGLRYYRAGDAVNFAIGQGDTIVTPLQLARAYAAARPTAAPSTRPRVAKAIVQPDGTVLKKFRPKLVGHARRRRRACSTSTPHCRARPSSARSPGSSIDFPLDRVQIRSRPAPPRSTASSPPRGSRRTTRLRRRDDGDPGRHRLRHLRPGGPDDLGVALRHRRDGRPPRPRRDPRHHAPARPADVREGRLDPPACPEGRTDGPDPRPRTPGDARCALPASTGC